MAVTDLTNTTWLINSTTCTAGYGQFNINNNVYNDGALIIQDVELYVGYRWVGTLEIFSPQSNSVIVPAGIFLIQTGMTIEITGGTDATNASLISWLEANATQIEEPTQSDYLEIFSNDERATHYKIYANGVLVATLPRVNVTQEGSEITVLSAPATQSGIEVTLG